MDFNSDLQPGDRVDVLFERAMRNGEFVGYGRVKAAIASRTTAAGFSAILFPDADGRPAYYDEEGRSLKRQFLKSPLPFDPRVTSRFSLQPPASGSRHVRAHLGVDYHAPYGTAVKTVAAGVVDFVGTSGEAGRMVRVRHAGGYQTAYLHLSAFAPGMRVGSRVAQGDLIGRVGSSGTATGPHLDYRIIKNGTYVDPHGRTEADAERRTDRRQPGCRHSPQVRDDELESDDDARCLPLRTRAASSAASRASNHHVLTVAVPGPAARSRVCRPCGVRAVRRRERRRSARAGGGRAAVVSCMSRGPKSTCRPTCLRTTSACTRKPPTIWRRSTQAAPMIRDAEPSLYVYRLRMGTHEQTGVAGLFSVDEYEHGLIKKHEKTRKDKEDDRTRHIVETWARRPASCS